MIPLSNSPSASQEVKRPELTDQSSNLSVRSIPSSSHRASLTSPQLKDFLHDYAPTNLEKFHFSNPSNSHFETDGYKDKIREIRESVNEAPKQPKSLKDKCCIIL